MPQSSSDDAKEINYYKILGVSPRQADANTLKKAYHTLTRKYHPDKNSCAADHEMFKNISRAYRVLSDPVLKRDYDMALRGGGSGGFGINGRCKKDLVTATMDEFISAFSKLDTGFKAAKEMGSATPSSTAVANQGQNFFRVHYGQSPRKFKKASTEAGRRLRKPQKCAHCNNRKGQLDKDKKTECLACLGKGKRSNLSLR